MKAACFIPIKSVSERVIGKNFRILNGKKLYQYIIENAIAADCFDEIFVDTNSDEIKEFAKEKNVKIIERQPELAKNSANGNDLLVYHYELYPDFDYYFQLFATAPFLQSETIRKCFDILVNSSSHDSCFTATENKGFFWMNSIPVNYSPYVLPRSQDLPSVYEETTGLYGISNEALKKYKCRIGSKPYLHIVSKFEAVDINSEDDLKIAEVIGKTYWNL